jgi:aminoglycoside phosphotransferase (APT) family kinase protein
LATACQSGCRVRCAMWLRWRRSTELPVLRPDSPWPWGSRRRLSLAWSIYGWLDGKPAHADRIHDLGRFAVDLAHFLVALRGTDAHDTEARQSIDMLANEIDVAAVTEIWNTALATSWQGPSAWVHGDVAASNLLVKEGRLCAVIDFGCAGVGDPSCDLVIAWTFLDPANRKEFRAAVALDPGTWNRARGWAISKALITLAYLRDTSPNKANEAH